jgi:predicted permease
MFQNYLKIAYRNILRHKGYSFINIFGLAIGLACSLLILLWVQDELSYDKFHQNAPNLYRVEQEQNYSGKLYHVNVTPYPCAPVWKDEIPEILEATRYAECGGRSLRYGENSFIENRLNAVDPSFFTMFDYPLLKGDRQSIMNDKYSIVLDEEIATKYFGTEDPIGKTMLFDNQFNLTVTGLLKKAPSNSILKPTILIHFEMTKELGEYNESWGSNSIFTFVQIRENVDLAAVNEKITEVVDNHKEKHTTVFMVDPLTRIHLYGFFGFDHRPVGIKFIYIFSIIAAFVLLIACINFMNLATARSSQRAREIGMRKVVGAFRKNLIIQFIGESLLLVVIAIAVSLIFVALLLPIFNHIASKEIQAMALLQGKFILGLLITLVITGLVAGSYPALYLSGFQPVKVLKGSLTSGHRQWLRRILVILQFSLSIILIIGTLVIYRQLNFMRSKDLGFDQEHVISINMMGEIQKSYESLKQELIRLPEVLSVSASSHRPTNIGSNAGGIEWDGKDPNMDIVVGTSSVDYDYIETMSIEILQGRSFSRDFPNDVSNDNLNVFMINETLAKIIGKDPVINEKIKFVGIEGTIVGVMKDFHFRSVHNEIEPLALFGYPEWFHHILIRVAPGDITQSLTAVEKVWKQLLPNYPFEYHFLDEDFEWMYRTEAGMSQLIKYFALLAIIIAGLGLFGLASFMAEQRTKEIGIRKTLGASVSGIVLLLSKEFTKLVLLANLIAWPLVWFVMGKWLQNFAYRIDMQIWIFLLSGCIAVVIALITVSFRYVKAALANPVKSLHHE